MKKLIFFGTLVIAMVVVLAGCGKKADSKRVDDVEKSISELKEKMESVKYVSSAIADLEVNMKDLNEILSVTATTATEAETKKEETTKETTAVKQEDSYEQYVNVKFPKTEGKTYSVRSDNKVKFYKDIYCTQEITDIPDFLSSNADSGTAPNGLSIYAFRTVNDEIIYSTQRPIIVEKEK